MPGGCAAEGLPVPGPCRSTRATSIRRLPASRPGRDASTQHECRIRESGLNRRASRTIRPATPASASATTHALQAFFGTDKGSFTVNEQQVFARPRSCSELRPLLGRAQADHRRAGLGRNPFPYRRRAGLRARHEGRSLPEQAFLPAGGLNRSFLAAADRRLPPGCPVNARSTRSLPSSPFSMATDPSSSTGRPGLGSEFDAPPDRLQAG